MNRARILAIDDEVHMLKLLERIIMAKTPYEIVTTNNSLEVPGLLEQYRFNLIIVDLKMPGLDGIDILRMVKEKERDEEVIIITAFGSIESATKALSLGVFDYITKPFKKEKIIFTVDRAIRWQSIKVDAKRLSGIFEIEPYERACICFKKEYLRRLAERTGGDTKVMAERSGLSLESIESVLEAEGDKDN